MGRHEVVSELVGLAYEAAIEPARWPRFLERIADAVGDRSCALMIQDLRANEGSLLHSVRVDESWERTYVEYYATMNAWTTIGNPDMQRGAVLVGEMALSLPELRRTEFYAGWLAPYDIAHSLAAVIDRTDDITAYVAVQRSASRGEFSRDDVELVGQVMPALQRALEVHRRLGAHRREHQALVDTAEHLPWGIFVVDSSGGILHANAAARVFDRATTRRILACPQGGVVTREGRPALVVSVSPLRVPADDLDFARQSAFLVFVIDPEAVRPPPDQRLRDSYGLTAAEAQIALALARGDTPGEIAAERKTSIVTVRTHIRRILAKTGARRQGELVALVWKHAGP